MAQRTKALLQTAIRVIGAVFFPSIPIPTSTTCHLYTHKQPDCTLGCVYQDTIGMKTNVHYTV